MARVIPIRDFSDNEIVLTAFGDWLNDRTRGVFKERTEARTEARTNTYIAAVRRFSYFIEPVPLCESTLAELRVFKADLRGGVLLSTRQSPAHGRFIRRKHLESKQSSSTEDRSALLGINMFEGFRREVLKKGRH
jgi:hypothetical protein